MNIKVAAIDLAKRNFQLCILQEDGKIRSNRAIKRADLLDAIRQLPENTLVAMEACATSHHWGRTLLAMGYRVALIPAQHVKAFCHRQKSDALDAVAICEAIGRPKLHLVPVKSIAQQDIKSLRAVRQRLVTERTATGNQCRGLAAEYGVIFNLQLERLRRELPEAIELADNGLSPVARRLLQRLYDTLVALDKEIDEVERELAALCATQKSYAKLLSVPGIGPITSAALVSEMGDGSQFVNGREFAAWCGLVPRKHGTGGKTVLQGITKNGNREIRTLLIHGARAVLRFAGKRDDHLGRWLRGVIARRGKHKAVVALANKLARIAWKVVHSGCTFDAGKACRGQPA